MSAPSPPDGRPDLGDVYETVLYGPDVAALADFYAEIVGLVRLEAFGGLLAALRLPGGSVLLLFDPVAAAVPGRDVPSHGATGPGHVAFSVEDLDAWRSWLSAAGVEIERELEWGPGRTSLYVRDPAGNSVEFVAGELWGRT